MAGTLTGGRAGRAGALCLAALLAACGGGSRSDRPTIRLQAFGDPAELAAYRELIAAFEAQAPGVHVELVPVGRQPDHMAKLATAFSGGEPPDLFLLNFRRFGQFAAKGVLEPLGETLAARGKYRESDFYPQAIEAFRFQGRLMCAPQNISSLVVYWNEAHFAAAGVPTPAPDWSWGDFAAAAAALTRDTDGDGRTDVYGLGFEPTLVRFAPFVWQAGGDIVDDLDNPSQLTFASPGAVEAMAFVKSWQNGPYVPPLAENRSEDHESRFARGGLGMLLHSRRYTATLRTVPGLEWDVAPLPRHKQAATVLHADAYCMAKSSRNRDAALSFVEYALGPAGVEIVARSGRTVPALKSVAESPVFLDPAQRPKSARVFLDSIATIRRTPNIATWNEIEMRVDPLIEEWYFGADVRFDAEAHETARDLLAPRRPAPSL